MGLDYAKDTHSVGKFDDKGCIYVIYSLYIAL